jgi:hypothetical protein
VNVLAALAKNLTALGRHPDYAGECRRRVIEDGDMMLVVVVVMMLVVVVVVMMTMMTMTTIPRRRGGGYRVAERALDNGHRRPYPNGNTQGLPAAGDGCNPRRGLQRADLVSHTAFSNRRNEGPEIQYHTTWCCTQGL